MKCRKHAPLHSDSLLPESCARPKTNLHALKAPPPSTAACTTALDMTMATHATGTSASATLQRGWQPRHTATSLGRNLGSANDQPSACCFPSEPYCFYRESLARCLLMTRTLHPSFACRQEGSAMGAGSDESAATASGLPTPSLGLPGLRMCARLQGPKPGARAWHARAEKQTIVHAIWPARPHQLPAISSRVWPALQPAAGTAACAASAAQKGGQQRVGVRGSGAWSDVAHAKSAQHATAGCSSCSCPGINACCGDMQAGPGSSMRRLL